VSPSSFAVWFSVIAAVMHLILGSLSTDGGASLLARYNINARLPPKALPVTILVFSVGSGVVDNLVNGVSVQQAFATSVLVAIASMGGAVAHHAAVNTNASSVVVFLGTGIIAIFLDACTPAQIHKVESAVDDTATCLVGKQDVPDEQAFIDCGITEVEKQLLAKQQLHAMREETTRHAAAAANNAGLEAMIGCARAGGAR
jgi:hypothetical protein